MLLVVLIRGRKSGKEEEREEPGGYFPLVPPAGFWGLASDCELKTEAPIRKTSVYILPFSAINQSLLTSIQMMQLACAVSCQHPY